MKIKLFSLNMKCQRCKSVIKSENFCQDCKNILLPYFENTKDWQMAYEMESLQRSFARNNNMEHDYQEYSY